MGMDWRHHPRYRTRCNVWLGVLMLVPDEPQYEFYKPREYVGGWQIGGNWTINVIQKPTDEQIKNTEQMFGWKWVDK